MEKIAVNNQIVLMRKFVKQAKVYTINKLVKQRKMVQLKKGTEAQLAKNKRKEEKLCEEIKIIKKISVDEISRKSLMRSKDWKAVLSSKTLSLEERSFALLASFEPLQAEVEKFIAKNPRLVNLLPDLYEEWDAKRSDPTYQERRQMKALEMKLKRKQIKARLKGDKRFQDPEKIKTKLIVPDRSKRILKDDKAPQTENENVASDIDESMIDVKEADSSDVDLELKSRSTSDKNSAENVIVPHEIEKKKKEAKKKEIAVLQWDELQDNESLKIDNPSDSDDESAEVDDDTVNKKVKNDPFFLSADASVDDEDDDDINDTADGSANSRPLNVRPRQSPSKMGRPNFSSKFSRGKPFSGRRDQGARPDFRQQHLGNRRGFGDNLRRGSRRPMNRGFSHGNRGMQQDRPRFPKNNKDWRSPSAQKSPMGYVKKPASGIPERSSFKSLQTCAKTESGLHPSWEAKRKLKQQTSQLLPFQGKKTTFE